MTCYQTGKLKTARVHFPQASKTIHSFYLPIFTDLVQPLPTFIQLKEITLQFSKGLTISGSCSSEPAELKYLHLSFKSRA